MLELARDFIATKKTAERAKNPDTRRQFHICIDLSTITGFELQIYMLIGGSWRSSSHPYVLDCGTKLGCYIPE